ncbi:MAG: hypothetical protein ACAH79_09940 [Thermoleophilia bacterium]
MTACRLLGILASAAAFALIWTATGAADGAADQCATPGAGHRA